MGKSNKKVKSDRINALRKQYDAFLEEDKKRKERNEFILGRLDKMRSSTALVPVRQKPITLGSRQAVVDHLGYRLKTPSVREFQSSFINQSQQFPDIQSNEDAYLIQQISKKYILIPKLKPSFMNNCLQNVTLNQNTEAVRGKYPVHDAIPTKDSNPITADNTDWKTKYEILNILKNEEKEKQTCQTHSDYENVSEPNLKHKSVLRSNHEEVALNYNNNTNTDINSGTTRTSVSECPEKQIAAQASEQQAYNEFKQYDVHNNSNQNSYDRNDKILTSNDVQADALDYKLQNMKLNTPNLSEVTNYDTQPVHHVMMYSTDAVVLDERRVENNMETASVQNEYSVHVDSARHEQKVSVEQPNTLEQPNTSELPKPAEQPKPVDSDQPVYLDEDEVSPIQVLNPGGLVKDINYNISEEGHSAQQAETIIEQSKNPEEITGSIADFEAEQGGMFYTDETEKPGDSTYTLEYSQNVYQQNQGYGYFGGTENYPTGINDEEVTQRYESNYEEQYGRLDDGLEQQPYQEIERVHLNQPELGHHQYEQQFENPSQIEETLDVEDRYIQPEAESVQMQYTAEAVEQQYETETVEKQYDAESVEKQYEAEAVEKQYEAETIEQQHETETVAKQYETESVEKQYEAEAVVKQHEAEAVEQQREAEVVKEKQNKVEVAETNVMHK